MEQQGDIVQNTSAEENRETQPTVTISEEVRAAEDSDTTNNSMDKNNSMPSGTLAEVIMNIHSTLQGLQNNFQGLENKLQSQK